MKEIAYHVTRAENLDSILENGLVPKDRDNFPSRRNGEIGIWIFRKLYDAVWWSRFHSKIYGKTPVFLRLDITGLEKKEDYKLSSFFSSYAIPCEIPRSRISLVKNPYELPD